MTHPTYTQSEFLARYDYANRTLLGQGGFGQVFKVYDRRDHTYVALKRGDGKRRAGQQVTSLYTEVIIAQQVPPHTNLARYEDYFIVRALDDTEYARMRYYDSGNLRHVLDRNLPIDDRDRIVQGIISGLAHLHQHSVIHRDLKPSNILIAADPSGVLSPLIADFGLGKHLGTDGSGASNSFAGGTVRYAAPEQLLGARVGYAADVWSVGVLIYELYTGKHPYVPTSLIKSDTDITAVRVADLARKFIPSRAKFLSDGLPSSWCDTLQGCFQTEAKLRPNIRQFPVDLGSIEFKFEPKSVSSASTKTILDRSVVHSVVSEDQKIETDMERRWRIITWVVGILTLVAVFILAIIASLESNY